MGELLAPDIGPGLERGPHLVCAGLGSLQTHRVSGGTVTGRTGCGKIEGRELLCFRDRLRCFAHPDIDAIIVPILQGFREIRVSPMGHSK